jgi:hypothetical protein
MTYVHFSLKERKGVGDMRMWTGCVYLIRGTINLENLLGDKLWGSTRAGSSITSQPKSQSQVHKIVHSELHYPSFHDFVFVLSASL